MRAPICTIAYCVALVGMTSTNLFAAGGTSAVAKKGEPVIAMPDWPEGAVELLNDPTRTDGWNSWFSEWPNDVNVYAFEETTTDDINRLIEKLAAIKSEVCQVRLSHLKEPKGLGWTLSMPEGNGIPVIYSMGDQARVDEWYKHVRKPFGVMEFLDTPVAVPPTLTIFVGNEAVNLDELKIPEGVMVNFGYVPTHFQRFNTKAERKREEEAAQAKKENAKLGDGEKDLDAETEAILEKIDAFLKKQGEAAK